MLPKLSNLCRRRRPIEPGGGGGSLKRAVLLEGRGAQPLVRRGHAMTVHRVLPDKNLYPFEGFWKPVFVLKHAARDAMDLTCQGMEYCGVSRVYPEAALPIEDKRGRPGRPIPFPFS